MINPPPMAAPPADTAQIVAELASVTDRLGDLIGRETELLQRPVTPNLSVLGPEKSKLAARYDSLVLHLSKRPRPEIKAAPEAPRLALALERLDRLAQQNAAVLQIHIKANQRLIEIVSRAAQSATAPRFSYGNKRLGYGSRGGMQTAVAVSRVF